MLLGKMLNKEASCTDPNVEPPDASSSESLQLKASVISKITHIISNSLTTDDKANAGTSGAAHLLRWKQHGVSLDVQSDEKDASKHRTSQSLPFNMVLHSNQSCQPLKIAGKTSMVVFRRRRSSLLSTLEYRQLIL
jgi:hypothetical protein